MNPLVSFLVPSGSECLSVLTPTLPWLEAPFPPSTRARLASTKSTRRFSSLLS